MDMGVKESNVEQHNMSSDWQGSSAVTNTSIGMIQMMETPSCSSAQIVNSFCPPIWDHPLDPSWHPNAMLRGGMFIPPAPVMVPQNLLHFPADSGFIERAARFSCFSGGNFGEMRNPFNVPNTSNPYARNLGEIQGAHEVLAGNASKPPPEMQSCDQAKVDVLGNESDEAEHGCRGDQEEMEGGDWECSGKESGSKKRKRIVECKEDSTDVQTANEKTEVKHQDDQSSPTSASKPGGSKTGSQGSDQPKEDYIHIRARRGQATNSHSLAERVRREKISERMKFLQDLVPGCSKVTGKAVMLDEIINYVQSLQRQVEFLSMKLATVNPRSDFNNVEGFLAKDRTGLSSSLAFPLDMTIPFPSHPGLVPGLSSSPETLRRPISTQPTVVSRGFKEPACQVPNGWVDELHNVVHMGFNSSAARTSQDLTGKASLPPGNLKPEH